MMFRINHLRVPFAQAAIRLKASYIPKCGQRNSFHKIPRRNYSSGNAGNSFQTRLSGTGLGAAITALGIGAGSAYYLWTTQGGCVDAAADKKDARAQKYCPKYQRVYNAIAQILKDEEYEDGDGSYGPIFVRLAWNASGTYCLLMNNGGSYKSTIHFEPEMKHAANKGIEIALERLEQVKEQFPWITYGDLWTLAGVCAVQELGGPQVPWRPGRIEGGCSDCPPEGRLPDGEKVTSLHPREVFYRMGLDDQEYVALVGAHTLGRCHSDRSGFEGSWTCSPTTFSNEYYKELLSREWVEKKRRRRKQFEDKEGGELIMLPTDMSLLQDCKLKKWVKKYAEDEKKFFEDFAKAYQKLMELGVPYPKDKPDFLFKTLENADT